MVGGWFETTWIVSSAIGPSLLWRSVAMARTVVLPLGGRTMLARKGSFVTVATGCRFWVKRMVTFVSAVARTASAGTLVPAIGDCPLTISSRSDRKSTRL